jgi:hypothetical protein
MSHAPWNDVEKTALNLRQADDAKHPYTCTCGKKLFATHSGWCCIHATKPRRILGMLISAETVVVQTWAHQSDIDDYRERAEVLA